MDMNLARSIPFGRGISVENVDGKINNELLENVRQDNWKRIAEIYRDGKEGIRPDGYKAIEYFLKEVERYKGKTLDEIADRYIKNGCDHYFNDSGEYWSDLKEIGNIDIFQEIAKIYLEGRGGVRSDGQAALKYLFEAATKLDDAISFTKNFIEQNSDLKQKRQKVFSRIFRWSERCNSNIYQQIAEIYFYGKAGVAPDGDKAITYFIKSEREGNRFVKSGNWNKIGKIYRDGLGGVAQDGTKAIEFFSKAEEWDSVAEIYLDGLGGVPQNGCKAIEYFSKSLERFFSKADVLEKIADIYLEGKAGIQADGNKVIEYLEKIIEYYTESNDEEPQQCIAQTQIKLAKIYLQGLGGIQSDGYKAIEHFAKVLGKNQSWALEEIAEIYLEGKAGVQSDGQIALEYLFKAVDNEQKNPDGYISVTYSKIAWIYLEGKAGVEPDGYKAIEFFDKGLDFEKVAEIYRDGKAGVQPNPQKAIEYFLKYEAANRPRYKSSAKMDDIDIFLYNSLCALTFRNIAQIYFTLDDGEKALEYFLKADEFGDEWSFVYVAKIYREGKGNLKPDGVKLMEYLTKKLEKDESSAESILYDIAEIYEEGCGLLEPNRQKALEFYKKAAALGNNYAVAKLAALNQIS